MRKTNLAVASVFLVLGIYLSISSTRFPEGMGRLPGPGFFPGVVGLVVVGLAAGLLATTVGKRTVGGFDLGNVRPPATVLGLLFFYLLLWGRVPFAVRTAMFVVVFLRLFGERWRSALTVAVVLTLAVLLAFQYGLRVDLQ